MPPALGGSQALSRLDLHAPGQICVKIRTASVHVIPLTVMKTCARRRTRGGGTAADRAALRGALAGKEGKKESARRAGERLGYPAGEKR